MNFRANSGIWGTMFGVPFIVADNFLKLATGEQIKVLLYILRNSGKLCSDEEIAANVGISPQEAADALLFWQQANVLTADSSETSQLGGNIMAAPMQSTPVTSVTPTVSAAEAVTTIKPRQKQNMTPSEISNLMKDSADICELFKTAEGLLGSLNHIHQNSLIWIYTYLGLKKEVIITLLAYCISIEKTNVNYIEKIAMAWSESEINTLDLAQEEITRMKSSRDYESQIMRTFEMKRRPTTKQAEFISQWKSIGFNIELIHHAYEITIEKIDKLSFEYINKILLSWRDNGYTSVKQIKDAADDYRKKKNSASSTADNDDFDVDKYKIFINNF